MAKGKTPTQLGVVKKKPSPAKAMVKGPGPPRQLARAPSKVIKTVVKKKQKPPGPTKPLHHHMFNPFVNRITPALRHEGAALPIPGRVRFAVPFTAADVTNGVRRLLFCSNVGCCSTVAIMISWDSSKTLLTPQIFSIPTLTDNASSGKGAVSGRAMRYSVTYTNTTASAQMGSTITYANLDSRLSLPNSPAVMTGTQWDGVFEKLNDFPKAVVTNGKAFVVPKTLIGHVVDSTTYHDYVSWKGVYTTITQFMDHLAEWPLLESHTRGRPMSTIITMFDTPAFPQSYYACVDAHFYTRWPIETLQGQSHREVPTGSADEINKDAKIAAALGTTLVTPPTEGGIG